MGKTLKREQNRDCERGESESVATRLDVKHESGRFFFSIFANFQTFRLSYAVLLLVNPILFDFGIPISVGLSTGDDRGTNRTNHAVSSGLED